MDVPHYTVHKFRKHGIMDINEDGSQASYPSIPYMLQQRPLNRTILLSEKGEWII
jgi:hypothetical protein